MARNQDKKTICEVSPVVTAGAMLPCETSAQGSTLAVPPVKSARISIITNKRNKENMEQMLDTATAAKMLGVTPRYLRLCAKAGKITYYKPLESSKYVFKIKDVQQALVEFRKH